MTSEQFITTFWLLLSVPMGWGIAHGLFLYAVSRWIHHIHISLISCTSAGLVTLLAGLILPALISIPFYFIWPGTEFQGWLTIPGLLLVGALAYRSRLCDVNKVLPWPKVIITSSTGVLMTSALFIVILKISN